MRTKTLLLTAALTAAGIATSMAAVYSQNAVGYVNAVAPKGFSILANPLNNGDNKVSTIFPITLPAGFTLYTFHNDGTTAGFGINSFDPDNGWSDPDQVFAPGTGGFVFVPASAPGPVTVTFVGEVPQGSLSTALAHGFNLVSSKVPQAGTLQTDLKYSPALNDTVYQLVAGNYAITSWDPDNGWSSGDPVAGPVIGVAEGFYLLRNAAGPATWARTFDVNNP